MVTQPFVAEVPRGCGNRVWCEGDAPRQAVSRRARLVHADVAVRPDAEQREVDTVADGPLVHATGLVDVAREIEAVKALGWQIDARNQKPAEHLVATARIGRVDAAELVEEEHLGTGERDLARGHCRS